MTGSQLIKQNGYASKQIIIHNWHCFKKVGLLLLNLLNMERLPTKQDGRNRTGGVQNASNDGDSWALSAATNGAWSPSTWLKHSQAVIKVPKG